MEAIKCIICGSCTSQCPVVRERKELFVGSAAILRAKRYIFDSRIRDSKEKERIKEVPPGVWSCDTRWLRTKVCLKCIQITQNILDLKAFL